MRGLGGEEHKFSSSGAGRNATGSKDASSFSAGITVFGACLCSTRQRAALPVEQDPPAGIFPIQNLVPEARLDVILQDKDALHSVDDADFFGRQVIRLITTIVAQERRLILPASIQPYCGPANGKDNRVITTRAISISDPIDFMTGFCRPCKMVVQRDRHASISEVVVEERAMGRRCRRHPGLAGKRAGTLYDHISIGKPVNAISAARIRKLRKQPAEVINDWQHCRRVVDSLTGALRSRTPAPAFRDPRRPARLCGVEL
jgi:hypothetical protein